MVSIIFGLDNLNQTLKGQHFQQTVTPLRPPKIDYNIIITIKKESEFKMKNLKKIKRFSNTIESQTIGQIDSNLNKLTDLQKYKLRQKRLNNLTQFELDIINKYKKVS